MDSQIAKNDKNPNPRYWRVLNIDGKEEGQEGLDKDMIGARCIRAGGKAGRTEKPGVTIVSPFCSIGWEQELPFHWYITWVRTERRRGGGKEMRPFILTLCEETLENQGNQTDRIIVYYIGEKKRIGRGGSEGL